MMSRMWELYRRRAGMKNIQVLRKLEVFRVRSTAGFAFTSYQNAVQQQQPPSKSYKAAPGTAVLAQYS